MIYVRAALDLLRSGLAVHGLAHITGGGLLNLLRLGGDRVGYAVEDPLPVPAVFELIARGRATSPAAEMWEVFNMGCGFVAVVPEADAADAAALLAGHHPGARRIGTVTDRAGTASRPGRRAPRRLTTLDACPLRPGGADADAGREPWPRPSPAPTRTRPSRCGTPGVRRGDPALRDRLVLAYAPMVKWIAYRKVRELPAWCDMDDFISAGVEAILRSLDRFDPAKGATLEQFLWTRVHGAVLDELRKHDWAPRSVRRGLRAAGDAADQFTAIHGRHPTREELADATGMTVAELRALRDDAARAEVGSLNVPVRADDHQLVERIDTLEDRAPGEDPLDVAAGEQAQDTFRAAFTRLPEREQVLAVLLYVEGLTLREAGQAIGISESRASQLHTRLRTRLRAELADARELFATA